MTQSYGRIDLTGNADAQNREAHNEIEKRFSFKPSELSSPKIVTFTVYGKPVPQGSSRAFYVKRLGRSVITSANKNLKPWRQQISETAMALNDEPFDRKTAIEMSLDFYFSKPLSVAKSRLYPTVKPDVDKLIRAILDSCSGILFADDAQVVRFRHIEKHYGQPERVEIQVREIL